MCLNRYRLKPHFAKIRDSLPLQVKEPHFRLILDSLPLQMNKRHFGSGASGAAKSRHLECSIANISIHSHVFRKYLPRLSKQWGMPMETEAQQQFILDRVCSMPSFGKHMAHQKLQNGFAWNTCCYDQLEEYYGSNCVFDSELCQDQDPEEERFSINPSTGVRA